MNAREIVSTLKGRWFGKYGVIRCPAHDDKNPSCLISDTDDGEVRVHCQAGCDWRDVKAELRGQGLLPEWRGDTEPERIATGAERRARRQAEERKQAQKTAWAQSIWNESQKAQNSPVVAYLAGRGLNTIPPTIRFHMGLKHKRSGLVFPAMVGAVIRWPSNKVVAVHRTYLRPDGSGKAPVEPPKMALAPVAGGAVRLAKHTDKLALTEGIETGLSVQKATGIPTWACLSTSGLKGVVVPDDVPEILIFADGDYPGHIAANHAAERLTLAGHRVRLVPAPNGKDWNDVLLAGASGQMECA